MTVCCFIHLLHLILSPSLWLFILSKSFIHQRPQIIKKCLLKLEQPKFCNISSMPNITHSCVCFTSFLFRNGLLPKHRLFSDVHYSSLSTVCWYLSAQGLSADISIWIPSNWDDGIALNILDPFFSITHSSSMPVRCAFWSACVFISWALPALESNTSMNSVKKVPGGDASLSVKTAEEFGKSAAHEDYWDRLMLLEAVMHSIHIVLSCGVGWNRH